VHAAVIFPLLASLIVLGPVLIPFVLGGEWIPAVRPAQILAVAGMVAAVLTGYPQVMLAVGRPRALLNFNVAMLIGYAAIVAAVAQQGLITISIAVVVGYLAILAGVYRFMLQRHLGISIGRLVPELGPAVVGCLALAVIDEPLRRLLYPAIGAAPTIVIAGSAGIAAYCLALRFVSRATWNDLSGLAARVLPLPSAVSARLSSRRSGELPVPVPQPQPTAVAHPHG
jgi:O-antigen/teichoic acid export membrane protein